MRKLLLHINLLLIYFTIYGAASAQETDDKSKSPVAFGLSYSGDLVNNYSGGLRKGTRYLGFAGLQITLNSEAAGLWKGGSLFINAINTHGGKPSGEFVGDYQGVSNIEAGNLTFLQELWYSQSVGNLNLFIGLQDLAASFAVSDYGALLLNGSFGTIPTLSHNIPAPVFPLATPGIQVHWNAAEKLSAKLALFDGLPRDPSINPFNKSWQLKPRDGIIAAAEIGLKNSFLPDYPGSYKAGVYFHKHSSYAGGNSGFPYDNNYGFYLLADQMIWKGSGGKMFGAFLQSGFSPASKNENNMYLGAGINYTGIFQADGRDILGFGIAHASFSSSRKAETAFEISYKLPLTENVFIQPDMQFIINPAGSETELKSTAAAILRVGLNL
ncbi:MAG: carbohydrate porin [Syntrophothermus sp.]